jgi:hypothetical protein
MKDAYAAETAPPRPGFNRTATFEGPAQLRQEQASGSQQWPARTISETYSSQRNVANQSRPISRVYEDPYQDPPEETSPFNGNYGGSVSRRGSSVTLNGVSLHKKAPPPPPPSRAKKPAPPPPMKRPMLSAGEA